jgi:hypothetical protein
MRGDWRLLTAHLRASRRQRIELSDDEMRTITHSTDSRTTLPLADHPRCTIWRRADDAGYDVAFSPTFRKIKVFTRRR